MQSTPIPRRAFLQTLALTGGFGGLGAYGHWMEPGWLEITRTQVSFFPTPSERPFRLLVLSDFHYSPVVPLELIEEAITLGLAENPDLVLLAGDFVTERLYRPEAYSNVLRRIPAIVPCLACLGNHDGDVHEETRRRPARIEEVSRFLAHCSIPLLHNDHLDWKHGNRDFEIIGLGDLWSNHCRPRRAFPTLDRGLPRLVLCHNPDSKSLLSDCRWDLMACGHSHGGQMQIPLVGAPLAPLQDKRFACGLNEWQGRKIYTTRGVGNLHGIRINCRPEVSLIELV